MNQSVKVDGRVARRTGTRALIMDAAAELFAARGVTSTSIEEIAERAGIAKGSVFYNFESKSGLVEAIMARSSELFTEALTEAADGRTGLERRDAVVRALLTLVRDHTATARMMVSELFRVDRSWRESIETWRTTALAPLVADAVRAGTDPGAASLRAAAVVGATLTAGLDWLVFHPDRNLDEVCAAVLGVLGRD
jgi:AcrR family transcriptional regulator